MVDGLNPGDFAQVTTASCFNWKATQCIFSEFATAPKRIDSLRERMAYSGVAGFTRGHSSHTSNRLDLLRDRSYLRRFQPGRERVFVVWFRVYFGSVRT